MRRTVLWLAVAAIGIMAVWAISCGAGSACQDLLYNLCNCETDKSSKDACTKEVDGEKFSAEQDAECSKYTGTCTCSTYKDPAQAKTACGGLTVGS